MSLDIVFPNAEQMDTQNAILARIANKLGAFETPTTWAAIQAAVRAGLIGQFVSPGDQLEVQMNEVVSASVSGEGITSAAVDKDTFLAAAGTQHDRYVFTFGGSTWSYRGEPVRLADFGVSTTGTAVDGDTIFVTRTADIYDFDVLGIDEDVPADPMQKHVLTIQMHGVWPTAIAFSKRRPLFVVTEQMCEDMGWETTGDNAGMPPGTYHIVLCCGAYNGETGEDGFYAFTTNEYVPIGGSVYHTTIGQYHSGQNAYKVANITAGKFKTYTADSSLIETCNTSTAEAETVDDIGAGVVVCLAVCTGSLEVYWDPASFTPASYYFVVFTPEHAYGRNCWADSVLREYLNGDFLETLDPELRSVLCRVQSLYTEGGWSDLDGYEPRICEDYVTLCTLTDLGFTAPHPGSEGPWNGQNVVRTSPYTYWSLLGNKQKFTPEGVPAQWWTATARDDYGSTYYVDEAGFTALRKANVTYGFASPVLHIG